MPKNAYLKFNISTAGVAKFDNSAFCLFERIVVSSKAVVSDELRGVPSYYNLALSLENMPLAGYNTPIGQGNDDRIPHVGLELSTDAAAPTTICLPFTHGIFGADKYLPLFSEAGITFEFYLNQVSQALLAANTTDANFTIKNVEFVYPMLTLPEATFNKLNGDIENYYLDVNSCFHHQIGVPAGSVRENHIIPARYSSINSIILMMRNTTHSTDVARVKYSTRNANRLQSIQFRHKGQNYPEQALTRVTSADTDVATQNAKGSSEMFLESLSTYASVNSYQFKQKGDMFVLKHQSLEDADTQADGDQRNVISTYEREDGTVAAFVNVTTIISNADNATFCSFFVASSGRYLSDKPNAGALYRKGKEK